MNSFTALHHQDDILILPNAWDVASARIFEEAGFLAIGTSSAGIAFSLGYRDGEQMPWPEHLEVLRRIMRAVSVPVSADIEAGYGDLTRVIGDVAGVGIAGVNLEDAQRDALVSLPEQVSRIREAKRAPLFVNARTDVFWLEIGPVEKRLELAIHRIKTFVEAGVDCVFVPGLRDPEMIAELTSAAGVPVNILGGVGVPSISELQRLGVKRVSVGSGPMRATMGLVRRIAEDLRMDGTYSSIVEGAFPYAAANALFLRDN